MRLLNRFDSVCQWQLPVPEEIRVSPEHPLLVAVSGNGTNALYDSKFGEWLRRIRVGGQAVGVSALALNRKNRPWLQCYLHDGIMGAQNFVQSPSSRESLSAKEWAEAVVNNAKSHLDETKKWHTQFKKDLFDYLSCWLHEDENKALIMANPTVLGERYNDQMPIEEPNFAEFVEQHLNLFFTVAFPSFSEDYADETPLLKKLLDVAAQLSDPHSSIGQGILETVKIYANSLPKARREKERLVSEGYLALEVAAIEKIVERIGRTPFKGAYGYLGGRSPMVGNTLAAFGRDAANSWVGPSLQLSEELSAELDGIHESLLNALAEREGLIEGMKARLSFDQLSALYSFFNNKLNAICADFKKKVSILKGVAQELNPSRPFIEQFPLKIKIIFGSDDKPKEMSFEKLHALTGFIEAMRSCLADFERNCVELDKKCQEYCPLEEIKQPPPVEAAASSLILRHHERSFADARALRLWYLAQAAGPYIGRQGVAHLLWLMMMNTEKRDPSQDSYQSRSLDSSRDRFFRKSHQSAPPCGRRRRALSLHEETGGQGMSDELSALLRDMDEKLSGAPGFK